MLKWGSLCINPNLFIRITSSGSLKYMEFDPENSLKSLLVILFFHIGIYVIIKTLKPIRNYKSSIIDTNFGLVLVFFLIIRLIIQTLFGWGHGQDFQSGWLVNIIPYSSILFLIFIYQGKFKNLMVLLVLTSGILLGSRSVVFTMFFVWLFFEFIKTAEIRLSLLRLTIFFFLLMTSWALSTFYRGGISEFSLLEITRIITRLGAPYDALYLISNSTSEQMQLAQNFVFDINSQIKFYINAIIPGNLFDTTNGFSGDIFKTIWFDESIKLKQGDVWSGLGYIYVISPFLTLVFPIILMFCIRALSRITEFKRGILIIFIIYYFSVAWHQVGMFDAFSLDITYFFIQWLVIIVVYSISKILKNDFNKRIKPV